MTKEETNNKALRIRVNAFAHKVLDRAIEYGKGSRKAECCAWVIEDLVKKNPQYVSYIAEYFESNGDKDLIEEWEKLKNELCEYHSQYDI